MGMVGKNIEYVQYLVKEHVTILLFKFCCRKADTGKVVVHAHDKTPHTLSKMEDLLHMPASQTQPL